MPRRKRQQNKLHSHQSVDFSHAWKQSVDQSGWDVEDTSYLNPKATEHQDRVDELKGLIPFWIRGVHAAERGEEVTKMAEFYERMEAQQNSWAWGSSGDSHKIEGQYEGWVTTADDWGRCADAGVWNRQNVNGGWGNFVHDDACVSDDTEQQDVVSGPRRQRKDGSDSDGVDREVRELVSKYARDVRPERRRQMYDFVQMRTEDKVQKIQEMIYRLQSNEF